MAMCIYIHMRMSMRSGHPFSTAAAANRPPSAHHLSHLPLLVGPANTVRNRASPISMGYNFNNDTMQKLWISIYSDLMAIIVTYIYTYIYIVVLTILKNMKVNGKDYPIYYGK